MKAYTRLLERYGVVSDLGAAGSLLDWDEQTHMPSAGAAARARVRTTIATVQGDYLVSRETLRLLERAERELRDEDPDSDRVAIVRAIRHDYEQASRVPPQVMAELSLVGSASQNAWIKAREAGNFRIFQPHLKKVVALTRRIATLRGYERHPYDALLPDYEPGLTTGQLNRLFAQLKPRLQELARNPALKRYADTGLLSDGFDPKKQLAFARKMLRSIGLSVEHGRLDTAVHPFASGIASSADARATMRRDCHSFDMLSALHECGHALYELGVKRSYARTPLAELTSTALHESQSRLLENIIGRSRTFWCHWYPRLQKLFPAKLKGVDLEEFFVALNRVGPSFIRTESDEIHYNLHIILRFELEKELVTGELEVEDLPDAWNDRFEEMFGIRPKNDREGVLQDIHWSDGSFGYFPTYTLGNLISAQLSEKMFADLPLLRHEISLGEYGNLRRWLRKNIHQHGRKYSARELVKRATGQDISADAFLRYLSKKFIGA